MKHKMQTVYLKSTPMVLKCHSNKLM